MDELYVGDFEGFVDRRNELVKRLRAAGDREAADRVKALKKPTRVAWALNQLGDDEVAPVLEAGEALRGAQEAVVAGDADSDDLREASSEERAAVSRALDALEGDLSDAATEKARQTLHAVALDEDVRREFTEHRLTTEHDAPGLGELAAPAKAKPKAKARAREAKGNRRKREALEKAQDEARAAETRRQDAEREVEEARKAAQRAQRSLERTTKELEAASEAAHAANDRAGKLSS